MKKQDARVARTQEAIKAAFISLMQDTGFSKITVNRIAEGAGISRNTFYLHYTDKFHLLQSLEDAFLQGLRQILQQLPMEILKEKGLDSPEPVQLMQVIYQYMQDNAAFISLLVHQNEDASFFSKLTDMLTQLMQSHNLDDTLPIPRAYMAAVSAGAQLAILRQWLHGGMQESPQELAQIMYMIFKNSPKHLLSSPK